MKGTLILNMRWILSPLILGFFILLVLGFNYLSTRIFRQEGGSLVEFSGWNPDGNLLVRVDRNQLMELNQDLLQGKQGSIRIEILATLAHEFFSQDRRLGTRNIRFWYDPFQEVWVLEQQKTDPFHELEEPELFWFHSWEELLDQLESIPIELPGKDIDRDPVQDGGFSTLRLRITAELPELTRYLWILRPFLFRSHFFQYLELPGSLVQF